MSKADEHFSAGDYEKAEIEYKNVVQSAGLDPHAIAQLGLIYFDQGRIARTSTFLTKAVELQPQNLEVRLKLGYYYLAAGKPNEARDNALFILEQNPQHELAPFLLAESVTQARDMAAARGRLQAMQKTAATLAAVGLLDIRERKFTEAEERLEQARRLNSRLLPIYSALGQLYWIKKDTERAGTAFAMAAELAPPRSPAKIQLAQFNIQTGKIEVAKRLLQEAITATPDFLPCYILLSNIAQTQKNYDESLALLDKVLTREPYHPEAMLLSAQARMAKGEKDKAQDILQKAADAFPQAPQIHLQLGTVLLANGDLANAVVSFAEAVRLAPDFLSAVLALADANIRQREFGRAITSLKAVLEKYPDNAEARLLLADAYRNDGKLDDALAIYRRFNEAAPENPRFHFLTGSVLLQQDKKEEAKKALIKASELDPGFLPTAEFLVDLDLAAKQFSAAVERVEKLIAKSPADPAGYLLLAKIHLRGGENGKAEIALKKAAELQLDSADAHRKLAQLYLGANRSDEALSSLQSALAKDPEDFGSLTLMGSLQVQNRDFAGARKSYEEAIESDPKSATAMNNLAYLLSEQFGELDKAQELSTRARGLLPGQQEATDTLGWVLLKKGQYARAVALLEESAAKLPQNAEAQFHLGMAYYMTGQENAAQSTLRRALEFSEEFPWSNEARECLAILSLPIAKDGPDVRPSLDRALARRKDDPVALSRLAAIHEGEGSIENAIDVYLTILKTSPDNTDAALNAIRLYRLKKERDKALELAKATRKAAPNDGRVAHALGRLAYESGEHLWSVGILQDAARRLAGDGNVLFDLAEASYSIGQVSAAETALRQALEANPEVLQAAQARQFLELIAFSQEPTTAAPAIDSIENALKSDTLRAPALMAKATAAEQKGDVKSAKADYEKILVQFSDFSPAKRRLAILYSLQPVNDKNASRLAAKAREAFPYDADLAKAFGVILYREENFTRAISILQESFRVRNTDPEIMYYIGSAQSRLKEHTASKRSLQHALELGLAGSLADDARKTLVTSGK